MNRLKEHTEKLHAIIHEYQRYLKLNIQFIGELEDEGADTRILKEEVREIESKISELKIRIGHSSSK